MNDVIHEAVTPTVVRIFPTAPNRGDVTMRELVDAYMASYTGRDKALPQRLGFWVEASGDVRLRDLDADQIADHLEQLAAHLYADTSAKTRKGSVFIELNALAQALPSTAIEQRYPRC